MSTKSSDGIEYLLELADKTGVACSSVKDGHILIFTKSHLEQLLQKVVESGQNNCVVFVKRPDFKN